MPRLSDLITDKDKKKLHNMKLKGKVVESFVGQTPNLNSSLGVNAADGVVEEPLPTTEDKSKLSTFWDKNNTWMVGLGEAILGGSASSPTTSPLPQEDDKNKFPAWAWILIAIVVLIIIILVVKKLKK